MTALAANNTGYSHADAPSLLSLPVENGETVYAGGLVSIKAGRVRAWQGSSGELPAGFAETQVTGNSAGTERVGVSVRPRLLKNFAVTGLTSESLVGSAVYATDDTPTLTLARPSSPNVIPVGHVTRYQSSAVGDVFVHGLAGQLQASSTQEILPLGTHNWANISDGDLITSMVLPFHGKIVSLHCAAVEALVGSGGTTTLNLEIGTTDLTGGALVASTAALGTVGTIANASAITANNEFNTGDAISLEASSTGGTQTSGVITVYAVVERLPGI